MKFKNSSKGTIIALSICILSYFGFYFKNTFFSSLRTSIYNIDNTCYYKFFCLEGIIDRYFIAKRNDAQLIYSFQLKKGDIIFELYDSQNILLVTFQAKNSTDTINNLINGEKYKVRAIANNAKGSFIMEMK